MVNYKKVYKIIGSHTPLDIDCGTQCAKACCNSDEKRGMLLYPGEETQYADDKNDWYTISESSVFLSDNSNIKLFTCNGTCSRDLRPLACRIFPLMPYITDDGIFEFRFEIKGVGLCPLIADQGAYPIRRDFIDVLYDAFELLIKDDTVVEFIEILSQDFNLTASFYSDDQCPDQP